MTPVLPRAPPSLPTRASPPCSLTRMHAPCSSSIQAPPARQARRPQRACQELGARGAVRLP